MYCANCGSKIADDSKFCTKCGAKIAGTETLIQANNQPATRVKDKKHFSVKMTFVILLCFVLAVVGGLHYKNKIETEQWIEKGQKLFDQKDYTGASDAYKKAAELSPKSELAWEKLGNAYNI